MPRDDDLHLLLQLTDERSARRKREALVSSVVLHLVAIFLITVGPQFLPARQSHSPQSRELQLLEDSQRLGNLALPPDYKQLLERFKPPPRERPKAPIVAPKGLWTPGPKKEKELPPQVAAKEAVTTPAETASKVPAPPSQAPLVASQESKSGSNLPVPEPKKPESAGGQSDLRDLVARLEVPGASIQSSLDKARRGGSAGGGSPGLGGAPHIDKRMPNFSVDEPSILSDAQGVDFTSWLRIIYFRVRDNWYAVIPEVIRSGLQGRVVLIFDVRNDGKVENLEVVRTSGFSPYDRAAISSIKLSEPFPNFPNAFTGDRLTLQFTYSYNIRL